ncbi:3086_t:CDS:2 [Diversispora eburnea]|uniref:3086_t:CDS:1 n=1 Tax=Diversispora eburnea TaxID=1213867 RepID=A0A9N8VIN4_9GLOM|nr:3086_t:CDS:2 [Diversispora eburnea]
MSSTADPRRPNNIVPYHNPKKELDEIDPDFFGIFSLLLSTVGLIMKIKWASWISLVFAIISMTNEKATDQDPNSGRTSSITRLFVNYIYLFVGIPNPSTTNKT